jgi:glyoxylase-like metal-dependent hydrolase (beta-lactamase superfamily II)
VLTEAATSSPGSADLQAGAGFQAAGSDAAAGYTVSAIRYGTRATTASEVFLHYSLYGEPDGPVQMDYFCWLLRAGPQAIVVDCGFSEASGARRGRTMVCPPASALRALGVEPAQVAMLILSHAHYDHIGNLGAFNAAQVVMSAREHEFWTGPLASRPLFATSAETADINALRAVAAQGRLRLLPPPADNGAAATPARCPLADGLEVIEVGGHTPGQLIVLAALAGGGTAVLASDALHYYDEMALDRPFLHVADLPAMYKGFELLRGLAARPGHVLVAGHDPEVMTRFGAEPDGPPGLAVRIGPPAAVGGAAAADARTAAGARWWPGWRAWTARSRW